MNEQTALSIGDLTKAYGEVQALRGVDLEVCRGEIFGFLGPNGAGKTTTIRCLLDLIRPDGGSIRVLGLDPQVDAVAVRAQTGYLPGELNLESNLRVEQALRHFNALRGRRVRWDDVRALAERLGLELSTPIKNLSKGNKQKVGVIQAVMHRPPLLLLDEPTSGLDPLVQQEVYRLLREAREDGTTVFFSSHVISEVEALADRVGIIRQGIIVEEASPRQLAHMTVHRVRLRFREQVDPAPLALVRGVTLLTRDDGTGVTLQVEGEMDELARAMAAFPISEFETERPSLEEMFLAYYEAR